MQVQVESLCWWHFGTRKLWGQPLPGCRFAARALWVSCYLAPSFPSPSMLLQSQAPMLLLTEPGPSLGMLGLCQPSPSPLRQEAFLSSFIIFLPLSCALPFISSLPPSSSDPFMAETSPTLAATSLPSASWEQAMAGNITRCHATAWLIGTSAPPSLG